MNETPKCTECDETCLTIVEDANSKGVCLGCREDAAADEAIRRVIAGF